MDWTPALFIFGIPAYLAFGFCYGIFREWSYQPIDSGSTGYSLFRVVCGIFNFPLLAFLNKDAEDVWWALIYEANGIDYWLINAFAWPLFIVVSFVQLVVTTTLTLLVLLIILLAFLIDYLSKLPSKKLGRVEAWIKKKLNIQTVSH